MEQHIFNLQSERDKGVLTDAQFKEGVLEALKEANNDIIEDIVNTILEN